MTYDTVKTKQRNKSIKQLKKNIMKNPFATQYQSKGFGMASTYQRPTVCEADAPGGEINQII